MAAPRGKLVSVNGKNMHLRQMGHGEKTIILLPGWGMPAPAIDFAPLMRALARNYTVCTIEFFGYGHSDPTDTPRTNENYVQEIREALRLAGLKPPYVLMPYSCAGVYCEYYAATYPEEIAALVLLDSTPTVESFVKELTPTEKEINSLKSALKPSKFLAGINRFLVSLILRIKGEKQEHVQNGYTIEEIKEISSPTAPNDGDTLIAQYTALPDNVLEVVPMQIPREIPILVFSSADKSGKLEMHRKGHMAKLGRQAKLVMLDDSTHTDIYWRRVYREAICEEITEFLR